MRDYVLFYLNGERLAVCGETVFWGLADFLRHKRGLVGTKIGCSEGDCGACTVLVGRPESASLRYLPLCSCIQSVFQVDGSHVVTVEGLRDNGNLSPVQQAMVDHHGSQCGYCTPGIVMAMTGVFEDDPAVDLERLKTGLSGNLCRCTGYIPILEAGLSVDPERFRPLSALYLPQEMNADLAATASMPLLVEVQSTAHAIGPQRKTFFRPNRLEDAIAFKGQHPDAAIVSGGTELGFLRNTQGRELAVAMSLAGVADLGRIALEGTTLTVGANVTWAQLEAFSRNTLPLVHEMTEKFASPQIRNIATLVGNIAHGAAVADSLCLLTITGAELEAASARGTRRIGIGSFYKAPQVNTLAPDEIITQVRIPLPADEEWVKVYKITKRREMDISTFRAGIRIARQGGRIKQAVIAYSGVGPMVRRLPATEAFLAGREISLETFRAAGASARAEVEPLLNGRSSRDYRLRLAENILLKFFHDATGSVREEVSLG